MSQNSLDPDPDPDPDSLKKLDPDPDPNSINPDPQLWLAPVSRIWIQFDPYGIFLALLDPDPYIIGSPGSGSVYYIRIRIQQLKN